MSAGVTTRVRGLAEWQPRQATRELLDTIRAVLAEYAAHLPLTLRQIFYRLVGNHGYPKDERAYDRLCETMNRARRSGEIGFDAIRDDGADITTSLGYDSADELINLWRNTARHFRLDRQKGQPHRLLIMVEAAGMKPQIERVASRYSIPVNASGGFDSLTAKYDLADQLGDHDGLTEILHIGDHDPSGVHLFSSIAEDVEALIRDRGLTGEVQFIRLAVVPAQIRRLNLPTAPPKSTDRRSFSGQTVQAEAIAPDVLAQIVEDAIQERLDTEVYEALLDREALIRDELLTTFDRLLDDDGDPDEDAP